MLWGILQWTCICFKGKSSKIVITPFAENSLQGHPFILFFFQFCQNLFFFFFFFHVDTLLILVLWEYCLTSPIKYTSSHLNLLTPRSVLHLNFLLTISLLNQIPRSWKLGNDYQIEKLVSINKFSLSVPRELYIKNYGEYVSWYLAVKG